MASPTYRFGDYRLDPAGRELWRGDEEVALPRKVFDVILYLFEHRDRAVEHEELFASIWGEVELSERVLPQTILEARRALNDNADEQRFIKTVRGYGYHWVAPVETVHPPAETEAKTDTAEPSRPRQWWLGPWMLVALLAAAALAGGALYFQRSGDPARLPNPATPVGEGEIALLLPVVVEPEGRHAWIRLGVMEHIADRLRAAGQPMVPSDNVIALARGLSLEPSPEELTTLSASTGARLVLAARAEAEGDRWRVSVRSVHGTRPPLTALGEAEDVLEAAGIAADHMALSLGRAPAPDPDIEPGLAMLLQQVNAAVLAGQGSVAREVIESAEPNWRTHPEIRLQLAQLDFYSHRLDAAEAALESLLHETPADRDRVLRARVLDLMAGVHYARGDGDAAERTLQAAVRLFAHEHTLPEPGRISSHLGVLALQRGDFDEAMKHLAQARGPLESTGDVLGLAGMEINLGVLEALRERLPEAVAYFTSSAHRAAALHHLGQELHARTNLLLAQLDVLDLQAARVTEQRLGELLPQTDNPKAAAHANVGRVRLLFASGRTHEGERLLAEVLNATQQGDDLAEARLRALVLHAEQAARAGDHVSAARVAAEVVEQMPHEDAMLADQLAHAWLILVRAELDAGKLAAAAEAAAEISAWATHASTPVPKIYAALAQAESAAAEARPEAAREAFERALSLAEVGHAPVRLLEVARAYVPWLLAEGSGQPSDPERATVVASRVARHAEHDYSAALLQLRLYHAVGPSAAWRAAFRRARTLAGERQIPSELRIAPEMPRTASHG